MTATPRLVRRLQLAEKVVLGFIAGVAGAVGITQIVFLVIRIVGLATNATVGVPGMQLNDPAAPTIAAASPAIASASIDSVSIEVSGLNEVARGWLIAGVTASALVTIVIAAAVVWLCLRLFVGKPFVTSVVWSVGVVAVVIVAGGLGGSLFQGIANAEVSRFLGGDTFPFLVVTTDLAPLAWAGALAVVAGVFELGQRLQRDTDGLV